MLFPQPAVPESHDIHESIRQKTSVGGTPIDKDTLEA